MSTVRTTLAEQAAAVRRPTGTRPSAPPVRPAWIVLNMIVMPTRHKNAIGMAMIANHERRTPITASGGARPAQSSQRPLSSPPSAWVSSLPISSRLVGVRRDAPHGVALRSRPVGAAEWALAWQRGRASLPAPLATQLSFRNYTCSETMRALLPCTSPKVGAGVVAARVAL